MNVKNKVDKIWEVFWTGGITNPLEVIEQFTYLLFIKQLDDVETTKESEAGFLGLEYQGMFNYLQGFVDGKISRSAFWELAKLKRPAHQISFHTIAALQTIRFIGEEKVYG